MRGLSTGGVRIEGTIVKHGRFGNCGCERCTMRSRFLTICRIKKCGCLKASVRSDSHTHVMPPTNPTASDDGKGIAKETRPRSATSSTTIQIAGALTTVPELWDQTEVRSLTCCSGSNWRHDHVVGRYIKEKNPNIRVIAGDRGSYRDYWRTDARNSEAFRKKSRNRTGQDSRKDGHGVIGRFPYVSDKELFSMAVGHA